MLVESVQEGLISIIIFMQLISSLFPAHTNIKAVRMTILFKYFYYVKFELTFVGKAFFVGLKVNPFVLFCYRQIWKNVKT